LTVFTCLLGIEDLDDIYSKIDDLKEFNGKPKIYLKIPDFNPKNPDLDPKPQI